MAIEPITAILDIGGKLIDRLWPDPEKADAAKLELFKMQQNGELAQMTGQMEINKIEAASESLFVAGWRPFIGWVCGTGCAWNWIGLPIALFAMEAMGHKLELQQADLSEMMPLLFGMLGFGALRSYDKKQQNSSK